MIPLALGCLCFGLSAVTCGSPCVLLRSQRINTSLQIETSTRTIHNHILSLFRGGDVHSVFVLSNKSPASPRSICTSMNMHTHWNKVRKHSLDCTCFSFPHQLFATLHTAKEEMPRGPNSLFSFVILFPVSTTSYSMTSLFFLDLCFHDRRIRGGNPCAVNHMTSSHCQDIQRQIDH